MTGLQVTRQGVRVPDASTLAAWARDFGDRHCIHVRGLLEPRLLEWLRAELVHATFVERIHTELTPPAVDLALADERLHAILFTLLNHQTLFDAVEAISGCDPIGCYGHVLYRMEPHPGHHDTWHGDNDGNRMIAMSINIGEPYEGGWLSIRERTTGRHVHSVANTGPGDAILFRIAGSLEHMVTAVTGTRPKTALAGWFQRTPHALSALKGALRPG